MRRPHARPAIRTLFTLFALALGLGAASNAPAVPVQWTVGSGGNGHWYELAYTPGGINFASASAAAVAAGGHLATIGSAAENAFVYGLASTNASAWYLDGYNNGFGPWLGGIQPVGSPEPAGGWQWVTGEPWGYTNWLAGQPDNFGNDDRVNFFRIGGLMADTWNDLGGSVLLRGYMVEWEDIIAPVPASGACLTSPSSCVPVSFSITNGAGVNIRGISVTFQLSANLDLCAGLASITEGTYLSSVGGTTFQPVSNGGGSYTVDCAILGLPCGATVANGTLFTANLKELGPDGVGTITITNVIVRDCDNVNLPFTPGPAANITIDTAGPVTVGNLSAAQVKTGNDADGTTKVALSFTAPGDAATVEVYRKAFGGYPQYDENGGAAPSLPGSYPPAGWTLTGVTASGQNDETAVRDYWYYVMYTKDACGNVSGVSNMTAGTLNYHLGDVHDGVTPCAGNNLVNTSDMTYLGANYGVTVAVNGALECLDVGPTTDNSVNGRPTTDNRVQFEDLILYAINFAQVSGPQDARPAAAEQDALTLESPALPAVGGTFAVALAAKAAGDVQGLSVRLDFDPAVVEFLGVDEGELLGRQGAPGLALSSGPGIVDVALLGEGAALRGSGVLANARFRVKAAGDARLGIASVSARDGRNAEVPIAYAGAPAGTPVRTPEATSLLAPSPNPSARGTALTFTLAQGARVELAIFGVDGRRVRTLVAGERGAGTYRIEWDGRDDAGQAARAGMYFARMSAGAVRMTRPLIRLR